MMRRRTALVFVAAISVAIGTAVASPAFADTGSPSPKVQVTATQLAEANAAMANVSRMQTAITTQNGVVHFDAAKALALGAGRSTVQQIATGVVAAGGTSSGIAVSQAAVASTVAAIAVASPALKARCAGANNHSVQWFGPQIKLDSCNSQKLIALVGAGAALATIAGLILAATGLGGLAAGILAAILALGAAVLAYCASDGVGIILDASWAGGAWCANQ